MIGLWIFVKDLKVTMLTSSLLTPLYHLPIRSSHCVGEHPGDWCNLVNRKHLFRFLPVRLIPFLGPCHSIMAPETHWSVDCLLLYVLLLIHIYTYLFMTSFSFYVHLPNKTILIFTYSYSYGSIYITARSPSGCFHSTGPFFFKVTGTTT